LREDHVTRFGQALELILHERGMNQSELARRLDITASAVNLWVKGANQPSRNNIERIEDELAVNPRGSLLEAACYLPGGPQDSPTVESAIRSDPTLDPEDKRVLLRILRLARERHPQAQQSLP
jgi:transcriptional regulator with XRE-family HTH domain